MCSGERMHAKNNRHPPWMTVRAHEISVLRKIVLCDDTEVGKGVAIRWNGTLCDVVVQHTERAIALKLWVLVKDQCVVSAAQISNVVVVQVKGDNTDFAGQTGLTDGADDAVCAVTGGINALDIRMLLQGVLGDLIGEIVAVKAALKRQQLEIREIRVDDVRKAGNAQMMCIIG